MLVTSTFLKWKNRGNAGHEPEASTRWAGPAPGALTPRGAVPGSLATSLSYAARAPKGTGTSDSRVTDSGPGKLEPGALSQSSRESSEEGRMIPRSLVHTGQPLCGIFSRSKSHRATFWVKVTKFGFAVCHAVTNLKIRVFFFNIQRK